MECECIWSISKIEVSPRLMADTTGDAATVLTCLVGPVDGLPRKSHPSHPHTHHRLPVTLGRSKIRYFISARGKKKLREKIYIQWARI